MPRKSLMVVLVLLTAGVCRAGWLDDAVRKAGENLGRGGVNDVGNAIKGGKEGKKDPARETPSGSNASSKEETAGPDASRAASSREQADAATGASIEEAETIYSKFDFIPGDKVIFFDDFSDTDVGEFPRKWTLNGPKSGKNNTVDVVEYQGKRFLRSFPGQKGQAPATQYLRLDQKGDFPEKFTVEFDAVLAPVKEISVYHLIYKVLFVPTAKVDVFRSPGPGNIVISGGESQSANTSTNMQLNDGKAHRISISVNGTFVKAYIDNHRVVNDPDAIKRPLKQIGIQMLVPNNFRSDKLMFTNFRLAEGGKPIQSALDTDGKIVTHGILFDTGKDTIKPESLPTLKMILGLLNGDPGLKFSIEGHTDDQGSKGINQPLSERRAEAVRTWLSGKGIDPARMKTKGFGDTVPIDSNKTPEGRANNRRVEFVKI